MVGWSARNYCLCVSFVGLFGVMSFFQQPVEDPENAINRFVTLFKTQDAQGISRIIQPEIVDDKDIRAADVENFLKRFQSDRLQLQSSVVDRRFKDEDGTTERFQATLVFKGPVLAPEYPDPSTLRMTLVWVLENTQWWLERPLSMDWTVISRATFPTAAQNEVAMQFEAAVAVLDQIGLSTRLECPVSATTAAGPAEDDYVELERLHAKERDAKGMDFQAAGVDVLLRAAGRSQSRFLQVYHGDFKSGPDDNRRPVPWDAFRDYVNAAIERGKALEKQTNRKKAEQIYRAVMYFGQQLVDEGGGVQFANWGITFQRQAARELLRLLPATASAEKEKLGAFIGLASRRLDLLQTALNCLDDMADYKSLKAAMNAAAGSSNDMFRPWGINTLTIFALQGAPAGATATKALGGLIVVRDPAMQQTAARALEDAAAEPSGKVKSFVEFQKQWVRTHRVYGTSPAFQ